MSNYFKYYQNKIAKRGSNLYERNMNNKIREFESFFKDSLTRSECLINGNKAVLVFQDHSQSNNKDLSDDKYIVGRNETQVGVGDYVTWRDTDWLVFAEEYKTINSHQQLKIKKVNQTIKWMVGNEIVNGGKGYGAYVYSQTLYTMGVAESPLIPVVDSKMSMYMQNNEDTLKLKMGDRVFVGRRVYGIRFIDDVSRPGLISYLLDESTIGEYDNVDLRVADYYKIKNKSDKQINSNQNTSLELSGDKSPRISKEYVYEANGFEVKNWFIQGDDVCNIISQNNNSIILKFKDEYRNIGKKVTIIAESISGEMVSLSVSLIKKF